MDGRKEERREGRKERRKNEKVNERVRKERIEDWKGESVYVCMCA